ncbi:hypothetical protein AI2680V1_4158 [Citrobacter freundii]|nr:hypothetical protein AI2680V1_4158 [Citrobacter freundii]
MFDATETIDGNPKSWAAWKREAERLQKIIDEMTTNHPAHGPVSLERLHQISEILSKASAQSDGGNLGYAMADAVKVIDGAIAREQIRREHAAWSLTTFGDVGPVGPLKHLSKEALEAAAEPSDLSEWADMQFLLWDAQRRAGISDEQITQAMVEKLAVNKQREWPEPKDGEPRLHIKESDNSFVAPEGTACKYCGGTGYFRWKKSANTFPCPCMGCDLPAAPLQEVKSALEHGMQRYAGAMQKLSEGDK